jgi:NhaP-type Na+/H+ or K+/H+ antiporter
MLFATWCLIVGALLVTMALAGSLLRRLPLSTGMLYHGILIERAAEIAVLISLFAIGLKLGLPLSDARWRVALRLASVSMIVTVALIAVIAHLALGLPLGAAVLLGAILAPTDPVLASDVQLVRSGDRDRLRFSLSAEGGLNDGTAFPFVMLGLGLLGLHELGAWGWRWWTVDVAWAVAAGLAIGGACGAAVGRLVVYLRTRHRISVGLDEFLSLGLIAVVYGLAIVSHAYGFLAVLAAGVALQRVQQVDLASLDAQRVAARLAGTPEAREAVATDEEYAGAYMMREVQAFNEQLERIAELAVVLVVGAMLAYVEFEWRFAALSIAVLLVVRPIAIWLGLIGTSISRDQHRLMSWFGIRGIGSIYYVMYAVNHGTPTPVAENLLAATLTMVAISVVLHGISVTPLMEWYSQRRR